MFCLSGGPIVKCEYMYGRKKGTVSRNRTWEDAVRNFWYAGGNLIRPVDILERLRLFHIDCGHFIIPADFLRRLRTFYQRS